MKVIEEVLAEPINGAQRRERVTFHEMLGCSDGSVVLFGAGQLGRLCAQALKRNNIPVRAFCDRKIDLHGSVCDGVEVMSPEKAVHGFGSSSLFIVAIWTGTASEGMNERLGYLQGQGARLAMPFPALLWSLGEKGMNFHSFELPSLSLSHADELRRFANLFEDEESLATLAALLRQRLWGIYSDEHPVPHQYFPPDLVSLGDNEAVADGGAFNGDTLAEFMEKVGSKFSHYHAFEPDSVNLAALRQRLDGYSQHIRDQITVYEFALYSHRETLSFKSRGNPNSQIIKEKGEVSVEARTLDEALQNRPLTFLKLDIEGAEVSALHGAQSTIRRTQPLAAVCVYHKPDDLWEIPLLLRDMLPNHRFALRQHGFDGWETVCYAIPRR